MKTIIVSGILSSIACVWFLALLFSRTITYDNFDDTDLTYPMFGLTVSWMFFLSFIGFASISRARRKVNLWPIEKNMCVASTFRISKVLHELLDYGVVAPRMLIDSYELSILRKEYENYKKGGGLDSALPKELLFLLDLKKK